MVKFLIFLFSLFTTLECCFCQDITTQQQQKILPPSPDAAALGKYGNIPVSTYTGIPNIELPIYTIKYRDIDIPISLSYHASGFTVEEESGWTGMGWVLSGATGVITRQIRGRNDLVTLYDGFYHNFSISNLTYKGYPYDPVIPTGTVPQSYITDVCQKRIDPEPDIFYFNFLGKSGSFILEKGQDINSNFIVGTPIKAEKIDIRYDKTLNKWIITTADGFKFYFNVKEIQETKRTPSPPTYFGQVFFEPVQNEEDYYAYQYYDSEDFNVTAWYIDKVVSPLGEEVTFTYDLITPPSSCVSDGRQYSNYGSVKNTFTDEMDKVVSMNVTGSNGTSCWGDLLASHTIRDRTQTFTSHIYLKEIQFKLGTISFIKSNREDGRPANDINATPYNGILNCTIGYIASSPKGVQKLDTIVIKNDKTEVLRKFNLTYSYFNNSYAGANIDLFKRLKLVSVRECEPIQNTCKPPTQLLYDETNNLPSKYSRATDFWGYYNGANSNPTRVPFGTYVPSGSTTGEKMGNADRQPNPAYMKSGILKKLVYPTGGSTEFEFEPHDYYYYGSGAFTLTDFENNNTTTTELLSLNSVGGTTADITQSLTLTQPTQINISRTLGFYPALQQSPTACCAPNPFSGINGYGTQFNYHYNEFSPYIIIKRASDNAIMVSYSLGEYQTFFNSCTSPCGSSANSSHGALLSNSNGLLLPVGTYNITIKQFQDFQSSIAISKTSINPRTIPLNGTGVYAKTAGGIRIKTITDKDLNTNITNIKSYDYTTLNSSGNRISSGRLMMFPINHVLEGTSVQSDPNNNCGGSVIKMYGKSYSTVPLGTSAMGSIVGYDKITIRDGLTDQNGRTEHLYKNLEESLAPNASFYGTPNIINTDNGLLLNEKFINDQGNTIKEITNEYSRQLLKFIPALAFRQTFTGATLVVQGSSSDISCYSDQANQLFSVITDRYVPNKKTEVTYDIVNNTSITQVSNITHDALTHFQKSSIEETNSKGENIKTLYTYPNEAAWIPPAMWQTNYIYNNIVEKKVLRNTLPLSDVKLYYKSIGNKFVIDKIENITTTPSQIEVQYPFYDLQANVVQQVPKSGLTQSYVWDYYSTLPVAQVTGAAQSDIAYSSFEADGGGNWIGINVANSFSTASFTGKKSYFGSFSFSKSLLNPTGSYNISYWSKNGSYVVNNTTTTSLQTVKGWSYYEHKILNPAGGAITIDGTGTIDELRLYPSSTQMITFTYEPLIGITSQTDANNRTTFYSYDAFGRLQLIKDQEGKILKKICYNYAGQQEDCSTNVNTIWKATGNLRCVTSGGNNTGYQEREERDNNENSLTFNQIQWVANGYNSTACPIPVTCTFSANTGFSMSTSGISSSGNTISFYMVFYPTSTMQPGSSYLVATINGSCKPSGVRTINYQTGGRDFTITIYPSGEVYWYLSTYSPSVDPNTTIGTGTLYFNL